MEKGIAFPVCLSVNNCVCHYSPLQTDESVCYFRFLLLAAACEFITNCTQVVLALGDIVKLDLGAHVDGYIAVAAHTFRVTETGVFRDALKLTCEVLTIRGNRIFTQVGGLKGCRRMRRASVDLLQMS